MSAQPDGLKPGTYRLICDVENPHADKRANQDRVTSWERWAVWPRGLVLLAKQNPHPESDKERGTYLVARGGISYLYPWDAGYKCLHIALEPVAETPSDLVRRLEGSMAGRYALEILDRLLTPQAVSDALESIHAQEVEPE